MSYMYNAWRSILLPQIAGFLALVGCDEEPPREAASRAPQPAPITSEPAPPASKVALPIEGEEDGSTSTELSPLPRLSGERFDRDLQGEIDRVDPSRDGWDSEVISQTLLTTLHLFADWTADGKQGACPLRFHPSFEGALFEPQDLPLVFDQSPFRIRRGKASTTGNQARWLQSWQPEGETHFKVIQLRPRDQENRFRATVLVDRVTLSGDEVAYQENAVWLTEWEADDADKDDLVLLSLRIPFFEQVEHQSDTGSRLFADATAQVLGADPHFQQQLTHGIDYWRDRLDWRFGIEVTGPHGLAIGDVNGDGRDDVYICETGGLPNRLLVQQPDGTARDIATSAAVDFIEPTHSALFVDWDNDGDQDLALTAGRHVFFYENDGAARFQQKAVARSDAIARSMAAADFDLDGDVDLYICGYFNRSGDSVGLGRPMPYHDANNGVQNHLLANQGDWKFEDVTAAVGLDTNNQRFSYAAVWEDADNDGDLDLYVANDFGRNNFYRNDGGRFTDAAATAGLEDISAGMSVSWADYNQDGLMDLYVGNMFSSAGNRVAYQRQYRAGEATSASTQHALRRHARGNTLFQNNGDGTFSDTTIQARVNMGRWAWSSNFADVNNDSYEDLLIANGMVTSIEDSGDL